MEKRFLIIPFFIIGVLLLGQIPDSTFIDGIKFLIEEKIIVVSIGDSKTQDKSDIPEWFKTNAGWWASGQIDDKTFATGIEFLIKIGLMK
ncbi:MAG: hypothetical protein O2864_05155 [Crenarchaeota archaeon]|nr:hypothetical protein [Thermoproteota archaeon]